MTDQLELPEEAPAPPSWLESDVAFMEAVIKACRTPRGQADLASWNRPGMEQPTRILPYLVKVLPRYREAQDGYLDVAAWYAAQSPNPRMRKGAELPPAWKPGQGNFGWSLAQSLPRVFDRDRAHKHLDFILRMQDAPLMRASLRPIVATLRKGGVPVSWPVLARDVNRWRNYPVDVGREWLNAFYDPTYYVINPTNQKEN